MKTIPDPPSLLVLLSRLEKQGITKDDAMEVFWLFYKDGLETDPSKWVNPDTPNVLLKARENPKGFILEIVERVRKLAKKYEEGYEPDVVPDQDRLFIYAHRSAAVGFLLLQLEGQSEEAVTQINNGRRAVSRLQDLDKEPSWEIDEPDERVSCWALRGLLNIALYRIKKSEGRYEESLHLLAEGLEPYAKATINLNRGRFHLEMAGLDYLFLGRLDNETPEVNIKPAKIYESDWRRCLKECVVPLPLDLQEVAEGFNEAMERKTSDWERLAETCRTLYWLVPHDVGDVDPFDILFEDAYEPMELRGPGDSANYFNWPEFWAAAEALAVTKLSPDSYRELRQKDEDGAAEKRLTSYFIGSEKWKLLPDKVRERLINADELFYRRGPVESILEDLKVAIEFVCNEVLWEHAKRWSKAHPLSGLFPLIKDIEEKHESPGLFAFGKICREKPFIKDLSGSAEQTEFLSKELPDFLNDFRKPRNVAGHEKILVPAYKTSLIWRSFWGIGTHGIFTQLIEIYLEPRLKTKSFNPHR